MKTFLYVIAIFFVSGVNGASYGEAARPASSLSGRRVVNFNEGWKFSKGDPPGAEEPDFDDSAWQAVRLPHDWAISGPFNPSENGYAGKLPWKGVGWYRKTFTLDKADSGRRVYFDFDGVMAFPKVYVNGQLAGEWDYGYMSFRVDATPYVKFGETNVMAVHGGHAPARHPVVSRRGDLSQGDDDDLRSGARGPLGHVL